MSAMDKVLVVIPLVMLPTCAQLLRSAAAAVFDHDKDDYATGQPPQPANLRPPRVLKPPDAPWWCNSRPLALRLVNNCEMALMDHHGAAVPEECCDAVFRTMGQSECFCQVTMESFFKLSPLHNTGGMGMVTLLDRCHALPALYNMLRAC